MSCSPCIPWITEPGTEEQQRLEEGVGDHVEDGGHVGPGADGEEHVAELRDRRVGEHLLDVVLGQATVAANSAVSAPDPGDHVVGPGGLEDRIGLRRTSR
jgi:hypothetical protein